MEMTKPFNSRYLARGEHVAVRPIRPQDAGLLQAYMRGLSSDTRRNRFLGAMSELSPTRLKEVIAMDHPGEAALLAFADARETHVIAEAILVKVLGSQRCEIALSVADAWQRKGVGTLLLRNLECRARRLGARFLFGDVLCTGTRRGQGRTPPTASSSPWWAPGS
jgi:GNAT superfamily N-acetyltransferase